MPPTNDAPLPRRTTKGPLDEPDDPLTTTSAHPPAPASTIPLPTSPPKPPPRPTAPNDEKDLTFLLHPTLFHTLPPPLFPPNDHHTTATTTATRLTSTPPPSNAEVFTLWYARLTSLLHLRHHTIAAREAGVFEDVSSQFWHSSSGANIIPWDLRVLIIRLAERGRVLPGLYALGREARYQIAQLRRRGDGDAGVRLWKARLRGLGVEVAEALVEEGDAGGAVGVLRGLLMVRERKSAGGEGGGGKEEVKRMLVLAYCRMGDVGAARRVWEEGEGSTAHLEPAIRICEGDFEGAAGQMLLQGKEGGERRNNLAVTHFYSGDVGEAVRLLEEMVDGEGKDEGGPKRESIFNLATCYELTGENGVRERKEQLVRRVGERGGGALGGLGRADFKL